MRFFLLSLLFVGIIFKGKTQSVKSFADSIRIKDKIPELAFAVISDDSIFELQVLGIQRINTSFKAKENDRFHIGSNTKAITSFIATLLVKEGKLNGTQNFSHCFPGYKKAVKRYIKILH